MNHDYAHCLDYTKDCPKECFRAELQRDIEENRSEFIGVPLTHAHLRGKEECEFVKDTDVPDKKVGKWIPVSERLPEVGQNVLLSVGKGLYTAEGNLKDDGTWVQYRWSANLDNVDAWAEMPKPWKGDEDEHVQRSRL